MQSSTTYQLDLLTKVEDKRDKYEILIEELIKKYPQFNNQIRRLLYNEDKAKVYDKIFLTILDFNSIRNFRISRDDNMQSMQAYKRSKIRGSRQLNKQLDSAVYSLKTNVSYYFGFDYNDK